MSRVLVVGIGGLGCPAAIALVRAGVQVIGIADDDEVDVSNLHRQILFTDADVGRSKVAAGAKALKKLAAAAGTGVQIVEHASRLLPSNAVDLVSQYDVVVEGSDNFATKFLAADACHLARKPIVHAAAVRWHGTALAVGPAGGPCYRCLFEDVPLENAPNCAEAGVIGPVVGIVAAAQADLALSMLEGNDVNGELFTFDGKTLAHRRRRIFGRKDCILCGSQLAGIQDIQPRRYVEGVASSRSTPGENSMDTIVRIPAALRTLTAGADEVKATGATVGDVIADLDSKHPGFKDRLLDEKGVRRFINIYVGEEDVRFTGGLGTELKAGDQISIIPAIAGG